jgi:hypothetical protein
MTIVLRLAFLIALLVPAAFADTSSRLPVPGYAASPVNAVSMSRSLVSRGGFQFAAYYGAMRDGRVPLLLARRAFAAPSAWIVRDTGFSIAEQSARDDHNMIALAVDAQGIVHLSWGMHNVPLSYAVGTASALGKGFAALSFRRAAMIGRDEQSVTYPEFLAAPGDSLLFTYRDGGSGHGNQYINAYDAGTHSWRRLADPMLEGVSSKMSAYFYGFAFDAEKRLTACWTVRETPDWQTNHDFYCARSADLGRSWATLGGVPLGTSIDRTAADAKAKIVSLPTGSSLINQAGMALDTNGDPVIATWWAPRAGAGDHTRQYMLVWKDKRDWRTSVISNRPAGEPRDGDGTHVRELGRPVVLIGRDGTTYVVTRFTTSGLAANENRIVIFSSRDRVTWRSRVVPSENPGAWEPVYDAALWRRAGKLALLFQPLGHAESSQLAILTLRP